MSDSVTPIHDNSTQTDLLFDKLDNALSRLEQARKFAKTQHQIPVLDLCGRVMVQPGGIEKLYEQAPRLDKAGIFAGTDWEAPHTLLPRLVGNTLDTSNKLSVTLDCLSQLRMLAIAEGVTDAPDFSAEKAHLFLSKVLALNIKYLFGASNESLRIRLGTFGESVTRLYNFILKHIGFDSMLTGLINEIWRILAQRPIQVTHVKIMITQIAVELNKSTNDTGEMRLGADRLVSAVFGPTHGSSDDPGLDLYKDRLGSMDDTALQQEAYGFARAMHDTGLVSDYHAVYIRWALANDQDQQIPAALGLSSTGLDVIQSYRQLAYMLIDKAIFPETAQAIYGLSLMLENGILYSPPIAPALWRQIGLTLSPNANEALIAARGDALDPHIYLLAGVISLLGQPLGVKQGNNPTCQSARALSMWAYNDPDYLLHLIHQAACYNNIVMHFEGQPIESCLLSNGLSDSVPLDTDAVSIVLVPHLDRIYSEMGRLCASRGEDYHKWVNPELHGWWVGREFFIAVDISTGNLHNYEAFLNQFYLSYHPYYNGNQPVIHPQPVGVAITNSNGNFVGWHAITLLRIALDQEKVMRIYFYNPNNDSGQNWGNGVVVSTQGYGERFGESSLLVEHFLSRLYIFHDNPIELNVKTRAPSDAIDRIKELAVNSWAADRLPE